MDEFSKARCEAGSLGVVFFSNGFVRSLDLLRSKGLRSPDLPELCEKAIAALHNVSGKTERPEATRGVFRMLTTPSEIATLRSVLERKLGVHSEEDARKRLLAIQRAIGRIKNSRELHEKGRKDVDDVLEFFEQLAEEGLNSCRQGESGEVTGADKIWRHYAMR